MDKITFVLPSRNNLEYLKLAYRSIRELETQHSILVLNDASEDGTIEWLNSLNDEDLIVYSNPGPERIGIVGMFDRGIEMSTTEIIFAFHADMVASPNLDKNILKHLKRGTVVCATRVEPPLHPRGPEKIIMGLGYQASIFDYDNCIEELKKLEIENSNKTTEGIFAPWCMYKDDFLKVGGHDQLFAPQSQEDSDLFNHFHLAGYSFVQAWDALVYHFTSRGSRFNSYSGGAAGINSDEWKNTTSKNVRNFIRKWGHMVSHDEYMKPIVFGRYNVGFVAKNCTADVLFNVEPLCDTIYCDFNFSSYIENEQKRTPFDMKERVKSITDAIDNDIVISFDCNEIDSKNANFLTNVSRILDGNELEVGEYEFGIFKIRVNKINKYIVGKVI